MIHALDAVVKRHRRDMGLTDLQMVTVRVTSEGGRYENNP